MNLKKLISLLKLPDGWHISDKQNHKFQKCKSYEISSIDIYVGEELEFIIRVFSWCIQLNHEIYTKYKKTMKNITLSNLITVASYYNICSGIKGEQAKKQPFVILYQKLLIFLRISLLHFIKLLSTVLLLIDKPNESCRNCIKFKRNALSTTKELLKREEKKIAPAKTNTPISQTSSERLKVTIHTYRMEKKEFKMETG